MKIPTLLALALLSLIIIIAINTKSYLSALPPPKAQPVDKSINQSNLTPDSISLSWETETQSPNKLIYTTDKSFFKDVKSAGDDRDQPLQNRKLHIITLQELQPNTTYYFKIGNQPLLGKMNQFTTPKKDVARELKIQPLVGSIIDNNLHPVNEVSVSIAVSDYFPLLTFTNQTGNFILPIKLLYRKDDLTQTLDLSQNPDVILTIVKGNQVSKINLKLDKLPTSLPPLVLGQDLDLTNYQAAGSVVLQPSQTPQFNFDVNGDGKLNSVDVSTVQSNIGKTKFNVKADIDGNGEVNQKDLDLIKQALK